MRVHGILVSISLLLVPLHATAAAGAQPSFEEIAARAQKQAQKPYRSADRSPPAELQVLSYDQYRDIRFRPDHALWRSANLPFELMFFHLGKFQKQPVNINEVTSQG